LKDQSMDLLDLLTVHETATMLKLNPETVRRHIASGRLSAVRVGRRVRIPREAVEAFAVPVTPERPLTEDQLRERQQAIVESETLIQGIRARRGGRVLSPSWPMIREARDERSTEL
jgi:excisionase family DNA binding protein